MKFAVLVEGEDIITVDVTPEMELQNFRALLEFESGIPAHDIVLFCNGVVLKGDGASLDSLGVKADDVILLTKASTAQRQISQTRQQEVTRSSRSSATPSPRQQQGGVSIDWSSVQVPTGRGIPRPQSSRVRPPLVTSTSHSQNPEDPAAIRDMLTSNPFHLALLRERNPRLADALNSGNLEEFTRVLTEQRNERQERERERIQMIAADPFDPNIQSRIAEEIRMENINANMETAMEYSPESFAQVFMLYINCKVNGHPVKAFVDSGAQMTIMSARCAERCHITHLIDQRFSGMAVGVGTQKIIGKVHMCQIQIENDFLASSFSVLEEQPMDMLLGLDMLKRHQCCIDLKDNTLKIGTTGSQTPFLAEADLPECARLNQRGFENIASPRPNQQQEEEDRILAEVMSKSAEDSLTDKPS